MSAWVTVARWIFDLKTLRRMLSALGRRRSGLLHCGSTRLTKDECRTAVRPPQGERPGGHALGTWPTWNETARASNLREDHRPMRTKADMLNDLKVMLYDALLAKTRGVTYPRLARAHGYVDGYMKALLDA